MPFISKDRKTKSRRKPKKKRGRMTRYRKGLTVGGFPEKKLVKLRYVQHFSLDAAAGSYVSQVFRANGAYDPDSTGAGHQPSNYDRWTAVYDRYTVVGAKITVRENLISGTGVNPAVICVHLSESGTDVASAFAAGGLQNVLEQPRLSKFSRNLGSGIPTGVHSISRYFSAKKFFGTSVVTTSPYSADIAALPNEGAFFEVAAMAPDGTANPGQIHLMATIDYIVLFSEPKVADAS